MTLLIVQPSTIAAVAASRGSGAANLMTPDPREVWADAVAGSAATLDFDLGRTQPIDTIYLGNVWGADAAATWTITGGVAGYAEVTLQAATTLRVPDVAGYAPLLSHAFWYGAARSIRYLRLSLLQPAEAAALSAGVLVAGRALAPAFPQEWTSGRRPIDTGSATSLPDGGFAIVEGARKSAWFWTLGDLSDAELDTLYEIALNRGETRPLLVVEQPDRTAGLRRRLHYGLFRQFRQFERQSPGRTRWELQIEDWGGEVVA